MPPEEEDIQTGQEGTGTPPAKKEGEGGGGMTAEERLALANAQLKDARTALSAWENKFKEEERKRLEIERTQDESKGDYKKLFETEKQKREEFEQKLSETQKNTARYVKMQSLMPKLMNAGFVSEAVDLLDAEDLLDIELETSNKGRFTAHGVDDFIADLKKRRPYAFREAKPPKVNSGGVGGERGGSSGEVTFDAVSAAEDKFLRTRKAEDYAEFKRLAGIYKMNKAKKA